MRAPRPGRRTLGALLARLVVVRTTILLVVGAAVLAGHALGTARPARLAVVPSVDLAPTWTWAQALAFPDCVATSRWDHRRVPSELVVRGRGDGATVALDFDRAWALNHNATPADDVSVLGVCL